MRSIATLLFLFSVIACSGVPDDASNLGEASQTLQTVPGRAISPCSGYVPDGFATTYQALDSQQMKLASGPWVVPVTVPVGTSIKGFGTVVIDSTNARVKVELVSTFGTLGSITSSGTGNEQGWTSTFGSPHVTFGGEQLWFRISPLTPSGAWATTLSTVESVTLMEGVPHLFKISPAAGVSAGAGIFLSFSGGFTGSWQPGGDGDLLGVPINVEAGQFIQAISSSVYGSSAFTITMSLMAKDDAFATPTDLAHATSVAQPSIQTLTISPAENVTTSARAYIVQFRAAKVGSTFAQSLVGPISLSTM
jgi:hypothetical protein